MSSSITRKKPVVLLAHPDKYLLEEARRAVRIEIEPLPAVFTIEDSLARKQVIWGEDNIFKSFLVEKGNVEETSGAPPISSSKANTKLARRSSSTSSRRE